MRYLVFIIGILILIDFVVESRRAFGSTYFAEFPKFSPHPFKLGHKFLPKYEYTVFYQPTTIATVLPSTTTTTLSATTIFDVKSTTSTSTPTPPPSTTTTHSKPISTDHPSTATPFPPLTSSPPPSTIQTEEIPSTSDSNFDWFGVFIVFLITSIAVAFFVVRRKCSSPSGTYKIPKTNLVPKDYYVNFCKIDDEFIEIHARALYGPSYVTSIENQNFEETKKDETCL